MFSKPKPMTEYLEDKYGGERILTDALDSINQILGRLNRVESDVAVIRQHANSLGWHATERPQSPSAARVKPPMPCDCGSC